MISETTFPENLRRLAHAIEASTGPSGIPNLEPRAFLKLGESVGLDADSQVEAVRWLARFYSKAGGLRRKAAKQFKKFAIALEDETKRKGETWL